MQTRKLLVSDQQVAEWIDHPVTEYARYLVSEELRRIEETEVADCYCPGNPQLTHENILDLGLRGMAWSDLFEVLTGDFSYLEEEDDEQSSEFEDEEVE